MQGAAVFKSYWMIIEGHPCKRCGSFLSTSPGGWESSEEVWFISGSKNIWDTIKVDSGHPLSIDWLVLLWAVYYYGSFRDRCGPSTSTPNNRPTSSGLAELSYVPGQSPQPGTEDKAVLWSTISAADAPLLTAYRHNGRNSFHRWSPVHRPLHHRDRSHRYTGWS